MPDRHSPSKRVASYLSALIIIWSATFLPCCQENTWGDDHWTDGDTDVDTDGDKDWSEDGYVFRQEVCYDGTDNDGDGLADCADLDCAGSCVGLHDSDGDGFADLDDNCPYTHNPAQARSEICVWPNEISSANSDPWLRDHHGELQQLRPRFLAINFANGIGHSGEDNVNGGPVTRDGLIAKVNGFLHTLRQSSIYHQRLDPDARPFIEPELVAFVDLQDSNGHANSDLFPRGQEYPDTGYSTVGYHQLFTDDFARYLGFEENGRFLNLRELVDRGIVNEVIIIANQVDGRSPNPPEQVTSNILEVAFVAQAYDASLDAIPGAFVKNGIPFDRQRIDISQATNDDHNTMPWFGRSLRVYFMNVGRGPSCLLHSLAHEFEFRYNESRIYHPISEHHERSPNPWMQPLFRRFADFNLDTAYGAPFQSLYAGGNSYTYSDCDSGGVCSRMSYPEHEWEAWGAGSISPYSTGCGNCHYPPGAQEGYDYAPEASVRSYCESFQRSDESLEPVSVANWDHLTNDPSIDADCGGPFLVYWFQNMPGYGNDAIDLSGRPMLNWWPFMYY